VLLLGFFVTAAAVGASRLLSGDDEQRAAVAALLAVAAGYLLEAGIDWMWELTTVSVVAMVAFGLLTGPSTIPPTPFAAGPTRRPLVGVLAVLAALVLIVAEGIPLLATMSIRHSQDAAATNANTKALDDALAAKSLQPWAASPYLQIALVRAREGAAGDEERPDRAGPPEPRAGPGAQPALAAPFLGITPKASLDVAIPPQHRSIARTRD
jgi:hypothetical protein